MRDTFQSLRFIIKINYMGFILSIALGIFIVILLIPIIGAIFELIGDIISAILDIFL